MTLVRKCGLIIIAVMGSFISYSAIAAGGGDSFKEGVNYLPIKPHLVVNYGGSGKVKFIKAELSLRTEDKQSAEKVSHHMPLVRDTLIMLISSVTDEQMASPEGKEKMRLEALEKINTVLDHAINPAKAKAAADDHAKDAHGKKEKPKANTDKKSTDDKEKKEAKDLLVSDVLFDNLVVQK